ncbi:hypothetical protein AMTRI_Chr09g33150 [Amborella trichopoda]
MGSCSTAHIATLLMIVLCSMLLLCEGKQLSSKFYDSSCPNALSTIRTAIHAAISAERRMGASLIRLHFHDCFVNGCDASLLLDSTSSFESEQNAIQNIESARGFQVIEKAKSRVESICPGVVSCADILAVAARDSSVKLGGPSWTVKLGRRDSAMASKSEAQRELPLFTAPLDSLISSFRRKGLSAKDLVALSGAHTIGEAQCFTFRDRIYNHTNIDSGFARKRRNRCPSNGGDSKLAPLDLVTPTSFDNNYFKILMQKKGLLESDQVLFNGGSTDEIVRAYSKSRSAFYKDFAEAMVKMGDIEPLTGSAGQIRARNPILRLDKNSRLTHRKSILLEIGFGLKISRIHNLDCPAMKNESQILNLKGCDASLILDDGSSFSSEKNARANNNSTRGFEVIDAMGGPTWTVKLGRRDSATASETDANDNLPSFTEDLKELISPFSRKGLETQDLVALSGAHTIGQAQCFTFRDRIHNEDNIDSSFASTRQRSCPTSGSNTNLAPLDKVTPNSFDKSYFKNLVQLKGLLHSDQVLFNNDSTDSLVRPYSNSRSTFFADFASAMVKMGDIEPLTGSSGQIRTNCRVPN